MDDTATTMVVTNPIRIIMANLLHHSSRTPQMQYVVHCVNKPRAVCRRHARTNASYLKHDIKLLARLRTLQLSAESGCAQGCMPCFPIICICQVQPLK